MTPCTVQKFTPHKPTRLCSEPSPMRVLAAGEDQVGIHLVPGNSQHPFGVWRRLLTQNETQWRSHRRVDASLHAKTKLGSCRTMTCFNRPMKPVVEITCPELLAREVDGTIPFVVSKFELSPDCTRGDCVSPCLTFPRLWETQANLGIKPAHLLAPASQSLKGYWQFRRSHILNWLLFVQEGGWHTNQRVLMGTGDKTN